MIYKVYVQETKDEVPVRERTKALYIEADSVQEVRQKLKETPYNIELIHPLSETSLEYEKNSEDFKLMEI